MERIKCPFCGEEINASSKFCPNCGRELSDIKVEDVEDTYYVNTPSNDSSWVMKWRIRDFVFKLVFTIVFVTCLILLLNSLAELNAIKEHNRSNNSYESISGASFAMGWSLFGTIFFGMMFLYAIIKFRVTAVTIDGYKVVVTSGFYNRLIVEDVVQVKTENPSGILFFRRYGKDIEGTLPNNKKIWANFIDFLGHAEVGIGKPKNNH